MKTTPSPATIAPEVAVQKAAIVAARIVRMRAVRERAQALSDQEAVRTVRQNLHTATDALRVFNRVRKGRGL